MSILTVDRFGGEARKTLLGLLRERRLDPVASWAALAHSLAALEGDDLRSEAARLLAAPELGPLVDRLLAEGGPQERALGCEALGHREETSPEELASLGGLLDSELPVARAAARALGLLGRRHPAAVEALLARRDSLAALPGLALLAGSVPEALAALGSASVDLAPQRRRAAARALAEADVLPRAALPILFGMAEDPRRDVQASALAALSRASREHPDATALLESLASDPVNPGRQRALRSLAEAVARSARAREAVEALLDEADAAGHVAVALGLGTAVREDLASCLPLVGRLARHPDPEVQASLAQALADAPPDVLVWGLLGAGARPSVLEVVQAGGGRNAAVATALTRLWAGEVDLAPLREALEDTPGAAVYGTLEGLGRCATIDEILTSAADLGLALPGCVAGPRHLEPELRALHLWLDGLCAFETETDPEARSATLQRSLEGLDRLRAGWEGRGDLPEGAVLAGIASRWRAAVVQTLFASRRGAEVSLHVVDRRLVRDSQGSLSLAVSNAGPAVAYDVAVELAEGPEFTVQLAAQQLASLSVGETRILDFALTPRSERFRVEVRARWSDFTDAAREAATAEEVLCRSEVPFVPIENPYIPGLPLDLGSDLFLGREDVLSFVEENLRPKGARRVVVLVGLRRMGKTSILKQIPLRLPSEYLPVFVDCQGLETAGAGNLLYHLCYIVGDTLASEGIPYRIPDLQAMQERPFFTFEYGFLKPVIEALGGRTLLLMVDEFQALEEAVEGGRLEDGVFGFLRSLMQHQPRLAFLFCGLQKRLEEARDYWQPVFNVALRREVGLLDPKHARALIEGPVADRVRYDEMAVEELLALCAGHPYLTQLYCDRILNHLNETGQTQVAVGLVRQVMPQVFSAGVNHFYSLWEDLAPREKIVLIALSADLGRHRFGTLSSVTRLLREKGVEADLDDVTPILQRLLGRAMIQYVSSQPPGYAFQVPLFRMWIEREMLQALVGSRLQWA